jgi:hypothetical protein
MKGFEDNKKLLTALEVLEDNCMGVISCVWSWHCLKQVVFKLWFWNEGNEKRNWWREKIKK